MRVEIEEHSILNEQINKKERKTKHFTRNEKRKFLMNENENDDGLLATEFSLPSRWSAIWRIWNCIEVGLRENKIWPYKASGHFWS